MLFPFYRKQKERNFNLIIQNNISGNGFIFFNLFKEPFLYQIPNRIFKIYARWKSKICQLRIESPNAVDNFNEPYQASKISKPYENTPALPCLSFDTYVRQKNPFAPELNLQGIPQIHILKNN